MRDAVRNKERWRGAVRLPNILVLTAVLPCAARAVARLVRQLEGEGRGAALALVEAAAEQPHPEDGEERVEHDAQDHDGGDGRDAADEGLGC